VKLFPDSNNKVNIKSFILTTTLYLLFFAGIILIIMAFCQRKIQAESESIIRGIANGETDTGGNGGIFSDLPPAFVNEPSEEPASPLKYISSRHKDRTNYSLDRTVVSAAQIQNKTWEDPTKREIDFEALHEVNPDIIGWIYLPGTNIDYPILSATEDEGANFYLKRDYNKRSSAHGSIFIQTGRKTDFSVYDTIIYGHNMKDGSMFQNVYDLLDPESEVSGNNLYIYTPDKVIKGQLAACYEESNELIHEKYNRFETEEDRAKYIESFSNTTTCYDLYKDALINEKAKLITLSTCTNKGDRRLLAQFLTVHN